MQPDTEDKKSKSGAVKLRPELTDKIEAVVRLLPGMNFNSFASSCIEAILMLVETPENQRITPPIVLMIDGVRKPGPILKATERPAPAVDPVSNRLLKKAKEGVK